MDAGAPDRASVMASTPYAGFYSINTPRFFGDAEGSVTESTVHPLALPRRMS
jgi:hypothetical protein